MPEISLILELPLNHPFVCSLIIDSECVTNTNIIHSVDPYCSLRVVGRRGYATKNQRTCTRKKTLTPRWDEVIQFAVAGGDKLDIEIKVAHRLTHSSVLAQGSINLHDLVDGKKQEMVVAMLPRGYLAIRIQFFDESCLFGLPLADVCTRELDNTHPPFL